MSTVSRQYVPLVPGSYMPDWTTLQLSLTTSGQRVVPPDNWVNTAELRCYCATDVEVAVASTEADTIKYVTLPGGQWYYFPVFDAHLKCWFKHASSATLDVMLFGSEDETAV